MSTAQREQDDEVKGGRERRLRSDADSRGFKVRRRRAGFTQAFGLRKEILPRFARLWGAALTRRVYSGFRAEEVMPRFAAALGCGADAPGLLRLSG